MLEIGSLVDGKYRILDEVGRGGMSIVYLARNIRTNKQWAIKEIRKDGTNDFDIVKSNLVAETDILKKLEHPNLPNIIDILDDGDSFVIIMDFIEGNSLQHYLKHAGAQSEDDVVQWGIQLCDVLSYLHSRTPPIIYRDMKPANVMLKPDGNVSLIDFGTAREYKETSVEDTKCLGTQGYAAPEQYGGHGQTDARTDIYCLGATLYHLVTGHNPAEPPYEMYPIRQWNPDLSEGLEYIIQKCTQKNPDDRFQSCEELMYALQNRDAFDREVQRQQRQKLRIFAACLAVTILCAVAAVFCNVKQNSLQKESYESLVDLASSGYSSDSNTAIDYYKQAIQLAPENPDAYDALRKSILADGDFDSREMGVCLEVLFGNSNDSTQNSVKLEKKNPKDYYELCYNIGVMYFALTTNNEGTIRFLTIAANGEELDNTKKTMSKSILSISQLLAQNTAGAAGGLLGNDTQKSYSDYWKDIQMIMDSNLAVMSGDVAIVQAKTYERIVWVINEKKDYFVNEGIKKDQLLPVVEKAGNEIQTIQARYSDLALDDTVNYVKNIIDNLNAM